MRIKCSKCGKYIKNDETMKWVSPQPTAEQIISTDQPEACAVCGECWKGENAMNSGMSVQEVVDILAYEADEFRGLARDYTGDVMRLYDKKYRAHIIATDALRRILQADNAPKHK